MPVTRDRHDTEYEHLLPLFRRLADRSLSEDARRRIREEAVWGHLPLADHIAQKYQSRGQSIEDLRQVARMGLIGAVDRFDPDRGSDFLAFAVPTIMGEVRRYFRDATWMVCVPRRLKELNRSIAKAVAELTVESDQSPRPQQIAARLGISTEAVYEGLQVGMAYNADSLDTPSTKDDDHHADRLGASDPGLERIDDRQALRSALAELPEREAAIVRMRFFGELTQSQIAERIGISQVHVSRLLTRAVAQLRTAFVPGPPGD
ncbi:MAG TPA: SigB/SigF/SigG family RNA polymerase sigma factor [Pseudonocardiaceae bacterium]|jgi:RNA polymerase sigma-B factor|nr:SigB/SigF/SigG family RNA polymerase sigma factor [Pseudonocardiaceae bacterium]